MKRSKWKIPYISDNFLEISSKNKFFLFKKGNMFVKFYLLDKMVARYSGKDYKKKVFLDDSKLGYNIGSFFLTRNKGMHKVKKNLLRKKK